MPRLPLLSAALVVLSVGLAACGGGTDRDYGDATERVFMRTCTEGEGGLEERVCQCTYDRITRTIPFEEYEDIDREVRNDPESLPDGIADIAAACDARIRPDTNAED